MLLSTIFINFQQRYKRTKAEDREERYYVPLNYAMKITPEFLDTRATHWLKPTEPSAVLIINAPEDWVIFNKQQTSYYRVNYDEQNWNLIINELNGPNFNKIHPLNRAQLIDDIYNFGIFEYISLNHTLDLMKYVKQETDFIPLISAFKAFKGFSLKFRHENSEHMQKLLWDTIEMNYKKFPLLNYSPTTDTHINKLLRMDVVQFACAVGLENCVNDAKTIYHDDTRILPVDFHPAIYCGAMQTNTLLESQQTFVKYINHLTALLSSATIRRNNLVEINNIISGIGCSSEAEVLTSTLNLSLVVSTINFTPEDRNTLFASVVKGSILGTSLALDRLNSSFPEMRQMYFSIQSAFSAFEGYIGTNELRNKVQLLLS